MAVIIAIPSIGISGFMVPINTLPDFLAILSNIVPLTYAISGLKTIMLRGSENVVFEFIALSIFMVVTFLGAVLSSKETIA
jgi:ABC-type multidrug transport system permease subunit